MITFKWQPNVTLMPEPKLAHILLRALAKLFIAFAGTLHQQEERLPHGPETKCKSSQRITIISFISYNFMDRCKQLLFVS